MAALPGGGPAPAGRADFPSLLHLLVPPAQAQITDGLISTPEADLDDIYLEEQAAALGFDPVQIFAFVRDQIAFESYRGSLRGARGTLWSRAGNALDQASLLVGLLRVSGIPARYVTGSLEANQAAPLLEALVDRPGGFLGCLPEGAQGADPVNDADLLDEAADHAWVEFESGGSVVAADPTFAGAALGETFAPATARFQAVPDARRHKVTLRLKAELSSVLTNLLVPYLGLPSRTVLEQTFTSAELVGKPLSIGHFVNGTSQGGLIFSATTYTYSPYLIVGQGDDDVSDDPLIRGEDYQELFTNFPLGSQYLTGLFLETQILDPEGGSETYSRALADRIGFAARRNGGGSNLALTGSTPPLINAAEITTVAISSGLESPAVQAANLRLSDDLQQRQDQLRPRIEALDFDNLGPEDQAVFQQGAALTREVLVAATRTRLGDYTAISQEIQDQLSTTLAVRAYLDSPRIVIATGSLTQSPGSDELVGRFAIDLRKNDIRAVPLPGQTGEGVFAFNSARGIMENAAEHQALTLPLSQGLDPDQFQVVSTVSVFEAAQNEGVEIVALSGDNRADLDALALDPEAKARISAALQEGLLVLVPARSVTVNGEQTVAWYQQDPVSGDIIGVTQDGGHQSSLSYARLVQFAKRIAPTVAGIVSGIVVGTIGYTVGALTTDCTQLPADQCAAEAKSRGRAITAVMASSVLVAVSHILGGDIRARFNAAFGLGLAAVLAYMESRDPPLPNYLVGVLDEPPPGTAGSDPAVAAQVVADPFFTIPYQGSELPLAFRAQVGNQGPGEDRFALAVENIPPGFTIRPSVDSIEVGSGQVAEVGLCVVPESGTPLSPGAVADFRLTVTSTTDPSVRDSVQASFTVPAVEGLTVALDPAFEVLTPGESLTATLTLTGTGNVSTDPVDLSLEASDGLTVTGLPGSLTLDPGEVRTIALTVTVGAAEPVNTRLSATVTARYGENLDGDPLTGSADLALSLRSVQVANLEDQAAIALAEGNGQLATTLADLAEALALLEADPADPAVIARVEQLLGRLQQLAAVNPQIQPLTGQLTALEGLAASGQGPDLFQGLADLFAANDLATPPPPAPRLDFQPGSLELAPGAGGQLVVVLENPGNDPVTLDLSLGSLPAGVTAALSDSQVVLQPREVRDASAADPVIVEIQQSLASLTLFDLTLEATVQEQPDTGLDASALVAVRPALADVVGVTVTPAVVTDEVFSVQAAAQVHNTANAARQVFLVPRVLDGSGAVVATPAPVAVSLEPGSDPQVFPLGVVDVSTLTPGPHRLEVSLQASDGQPLPGRTGSGFFFVGEVITASANALPSLVPPGDSTVETRLTVTNLTALEGSLGTTSLLVQYHTADGVVESLSSLGSAIGDPAVTLGLPQEDQFLSLNGGVLTLDLGEGPNLAFDGPGDDLMIFEVGDNESYDLEVSLDGVSFVSLGRLTGNRRADLAGSGLDQVRYVRITDRGSLSGATPGADIQGVRVLNAQGGVQVERVDFSLGTEGFSNAFGNTGIISTPIVANLDDDPTPEILVSTDRFATSPTDRFFALDALTGVVEFQVPDNGNNQPTAAVAELRADSPGPEVAMLFNSNLRLLAADGTTLWEVAGGRVSPVIVNVDDDPEAEILAADRFNRLAAFDNDGQIRWHSVRDVDTGHASAIVAADLDGDGLAEAIAASNNRLLMAIKTPVDPGPDAEAVTLWESPLGGNPFGGPAVADLDGGIGGDPGPEIVIGDDAGNLNVFDDDGTLLTRITLAGRRISPPTVADINADGLTDIVITADNEDRIYALTLTQAALASPDPVPLADLLLWSAPIADQTASGSGIAVYDLDGDGIWEVIWNGFGNTSDLALGGFSIFSGLDGRLIYQNTRINSRTWDENVTIADVDGDGHAELVAGDQEGLWIVGADDLWVGARDIWNQQSYHITNINADLTVPVNEPPSWLDHNTYRTQRPPVGVINRLDLQVEHLLAGDYQLDDASLDPTPDARSGDELTWNEVRFFNDDADWVIRFEGQVQDLQPGEVRNISEGTTVTARYIDETGSPATTTVDLPPVVVVAAQILDIDPPGQSVQAGDSALYQVTVSNPTAGEQTYQLDTTGLTGLGVSLADSVTLAAGESRSLPLTVTTPVTASGSRGFVVGAITAGGGRATVQASLTVTPILTNPVDPPAEIPLTDLGVNLTLDPPSATAGQGTPATFRVAVTNTGDDRDSYDLTLDLPPGVAGSLNPATVTVPPGLGNFRVVELTLTPAPGTASGSLLFTVTATSQADDTVRDQAAGTLTVSPLGVEVELSPDPVANGGALTLTVTNTGEQQETFDLALVGPVAPFAGPIPDSVTLAAGATQQLPVALQPLTVALPGNLDLGAVATARSDQAVSDRDQATVTVTGLLALEASFEPVAITLEDPGPAASLLLVDNLGNQEDGYRIAITGLQGPVTATLRGLDGQGVQSLTGVRLPALATGGIPLDVELLDYATGRVTVTVTSETDPGLQAMAVLEIATGNVGPSADAGGDQGVSLGEAVTLDGSGSRDPDNGPQPLSFTWSLLEVPAGSAIGQGDLSGSDTAQVSFTPDRAGDYRLELTVSDGVLSASDVATITVADDLPVADAGPDRNVSTGSEVVLDGSGSFDPLGELLVYDWQLLEVPPGSAVTEGSISDLDGPAPRFIPDVDGDYRLSLEVEAGGRQSATDEVVITAATPNVPPNARAGADQQVFPGSPVVLDGSASDDPDNGPGLLAYQWSFQVLPAGSGLNDGAITDADQPRAGFTPDVTGDYQVNLRVSDGLDQDDDQVTIRALPANIPPVADAGPDGEGIPGTAVLLDGSASFDPDGAGLVFAWRFVSLPPGSTLTDGDITGADTATASFLPDVAGDYVLGLEVSDGLDQDTDNVLIQVLVAGITDLTARGKGDKVNLVWSPVAGAVAYDIFRGQGGGDLEPIRQGHVTDYAVYVDSGLTVGQSYCYRIRWIDAQGRVSADSNEACLTLEARRTR